jgi:hypothetical protein
MSFFDLEVLKGNPTKLTKIKLSKNMVLGPKKWKIKIKITTHMGL